MLDSLKKRGCELLDRLPGALSSELMLIISQGESILAQNMQALLVGTLMDVTKNEAEREKSGSDSGPGNWEEEENKELQLRELPDSPADVTQNPLLEQAFDPERALTDLELEDLIEPRHAT